MNASFLKSAVLSVALLGGATFMNASVNTSLSEMTAAEIISILPETTVASAQTLNRDSNSEAMQVSGRDLITKAYGMIPAVNSRQSTIELSEEMMNVTPTAEDNNLWLDSTDGYAINYNGMTPDVSALVRLENDSISDYGFFFLFPYSEVDKKYATADQVDFSKTMLQEFEDMGLDLGANPYTSDLFEVTGDYTDNFVAMRLIDDKEGERYILMLSVEPNAMSEIDNLVVD
ncbi:MAG: hypothetical protein K2H96_10880 [Muribaculaceae bacterium]|nr:hypothetical protein [Muribaculaceae bacterium]